MTPTKIKYSLTIAVVLFIICMPGFSQKGKNNALMVPVHSTDYVLIYNPQADEYSGTGTQTYLPGKTYKKWQPHEHTFIKGPKGRWHCFGVTIPATPADERTWDARGLTFHALAPKGTLEEAFLPETWIDQPKFSGEGSGEALHLIKIGKTYNLIRSSKGNVSSTDLHNWKGKGMLQIKEGTRDPNILYWEGTYYLVSTNGRTINLVTSQDFVNWTDPVEIFTAPEENWQCESPTLIRHKKSFYLFWSLFDDSPWEGELLSLYKGHDPKYYDYRTFVYASDTPTDFNNREAVAKLKAHAPEIIQDEKGNWFISSADYPSRGINLARLEWKSTE